MFQLAYLHLQYLCYLCRYLQHLCYSQKNIRSDIQANLTKLGRYAADFKYVVTTNPETEIRTKEMLKDLVVPDKENIHILFVKDFLSNPPIL